MTKHPKIYLSLIVALAIVAGIFAYPNSPLAKYRPWRLGLDLVGGSHLTYEVDLSGVAQGDRTSILNGLRDVIERRVNLFGVSEPQVYIANSSEKSNLVVELAGVRDIGEAIKQIGETPLLDFREIASSTPSVAVGTTTTQFVTTGLTGRYVTGAQLVFDQQTRAPQVAISFNSEGAKLFSDVTGRNVGKPVAIYLDGQPISTPTVNSKITDGNAVITGVSVEEGRTLAQRFNAGALPAPIKLIEQQTIDSTLGANSLALAVRAGLIGTALVLLFMILYYRTRGIYAALALIIYIALTLALFKFVPITLTLAGLAGFILTIGMAVDANILIFERIKEEERAGRSKMDAIKEGFHRAWPSIRDSNMSTIITAIILYYFTTGFVRGFALTLLLGVLVSMFSAITTTRLFLLSFSRNATTRTSR
jgi:protein-export membrane protein SecD